MEVEQISEICFVEEKCKSITRGLVIIQNSHHFKPFYRGQNIKVSLWWNSQVQIKFIVVYMLFIYIFHNLINTNSVSSVNVHCKFNLFCKWRLVGIHRKAVISLLIVRKWRWIWENEIITCSRERFCSWGSLCKDICICSQIVVQLHAWKFFQHAFMPDQKKRTNKNKQMNIFVNFCLF